MALPCSLYHRDVRAWVVWWHLPSHPILQMAVALIGVMTREFPCDTTVTRLLKKAILSGSGDSHLAKGQLPHNYLLLFLYGWEPEPIICRFVKWWRCLNLNWPVVWFLSLAMFNPAPYFILCLLFHTLMMTSFCAFGFWSIVKAFQRPLHKTSAPLVLICSFEGGRMQWIFLWPGSVWDATFCSLI